MKRSKRGYSLLPIYKFAVVTKTEIWPQLSQPAKICTQWCISHIVFSSRWRHNGRDSVSNQQPHHCLLSRLFRRRSKKTSKLRVAGLCVGNSPGTGEFPAQMASNAENASIWWRHHVSIDKHWVCKRGFLRLWNTCKARMYKLYLIIIKWWVWIGAKLKVQNVMKCVKYSKKGYLANKNILYLIFNGNILSRSLFY